MTLPASTLAELALPQLTLPELTLPEALVDKLVDDCLQEFQYFEDYQQHRPPSERDDKPSRPFLMYVSYKIRDRLNGQASNTKLSSIGSCLTKFQAKDDHQFGAR